MTVEQLIKAIKERNTFLCVGLDTDICKIPQHLLDSEDPVFEFNKYIIDATKDFCVAFKPNTAFYECRGEAGWRSLKRTFDYIPKTHFSIADAKRGDIGNTSKMYAQAFFDYMNADSITVSPYMGADSVLPFLEYKNKVTILLALTSNSGAMDFQLLSTHIEEKKLYEKVLIHSQKWGNENNLMYVVGATQAKMLQNIRKIIPNHFLLVPGVGAQGGSLEEVAKYGMNKNCGLLVNASRSIIYASNGKDFAEKAASEAFSMQQQMAFLLNKYL